MGIFRSKNETEDVIFSKTKIWETPIDQIHTKPQKTLEFKLIQLRESFSFEPSMTLDLDSRWMIGLTSIEIYNSIINLTEKNYEFELHADLFDELSFSFGDLGYEVAVILKLSGIANKDLQGSQEAFIFKTH